MNDLKTRREHAKAIVARAKADRRKLTGPEQEYVDDLLLDASIAKMSRELGGPAEGTPGGGLSGAMHGAGYDRVNHPVVTVPFQAAASFDGDYGDAIPSVVTSPPLGADSRFLTPVFPRVGVDPDETAVTSFRQKSRTLPSPLSSIVRDIAAVTPKPETDTETELVHEELHQIATVETDVPNIFLESA